MYKVSLLNNTSDYIQVQVNGESYELESGETLAYASQNELHHLTINGMFYYEVITDFRTVETYDLTTILEIDGSGDILVRDQM